MVRRLLGRLRALVCGFNVRSCCVLDGEDIELMVKLYKRGWFVRVWKPGTDCWAELAAEPEESDGRGG